MFSGFSDTTIGVLLFIPVILVIILAAKILGNVAHARFKKAMTPLLPLIDGRLQKDGVGGLMFGTYRGRKVAVRATEDSRSSEYPGHPLQKRNRWQVELDTTGGKSDWSYTHRGFSAADGPLGAANSEARQRLEMLLRGMGNSIVVHYHARSKRISFEEDVKPLLAPDPAWFARELELMDALAAVTERID